MTIDRHDLQRTLDAAIAGQNEAAYAAKFHEERLEVERIRNRIFGEKVREMRAAIESIDTPTEPVV